MRILTFTTLLLIIVSSTLFLQDTDWSEQKLTSLIVDNSREKLVLSNNNYINATTSSTIVESHIEHTSFFSMADTTTYIMPVGTKDSLGYTLPNCSDTYFFNSDGALVYADAVDSVRNSIVTFCPPTHGRKLLFTFSNFNLSPGDSLVVYDGNDTINRIDIASNSGVFQINGGWISSNCDPTINPTGCLTFQFKTNGNNLAGSGWRSKITCLEETTAAFEKVGDITKIADCNTLRAKVSYTVPTLNVTKNGNCTLSDTRVVRTFCGKRDTLMAGDVITETLPYGVYSLDYRLLVDTTVHAHCFVSITTPSLVCNDTINAAIGQGCKTLLTPDDVLESFGTCNPFDDGVISQDYIIRVKTDTGVVTGTIGSPPVLNAKDGGNIVCNEFYEVFVTRVITIDSLSCNQSHRDSCSITVKFIDGIEPIFVGVVKDTITKIDTLYGCQDLKITEAQLKRPTVFDNCEIADLSVEIPEIILAACDTNKTFLAKWIASDRCGNASFAYQKIVIKRPTEKNLFAPKDTIIDCSFAPTPEITGWPLLDANGDGITDMELTTDGGLTCFLDATYRDDTIPDCGNAIKIIRYWSLRNFCSNSQFVAPADTQVIVLIDTIGPTMIKPKVGELGSATNPHVFANGHFGCEGLIGDIPLPGGEDNCDANFTTKLLGIFDSNSGVDYFPDLDQAMPIGVYTAAFVHIDECKNRSDSCHIYFEIKDLTSPTPVCTDELRVSMTSGNFPIRPEDIDDGSTDNCGIDQFYIRRSICGNTDIFESTTNAHILNTYNGRIPANGWREYIEVGCCDINQLVRVQLLAIDKAGNYNLCWLNIFPEDHLQPICAVLPDTVAYCDEYHTDVFGSQTDHNHNDQFDAEEWITVDENRATLFNEKFGDPVCKDNISCDEIKLEQQYQLIVDQCGEQRLRRRYRSRDFEGFGNESVWYEQNIHVQYRPGWTITFPADTTFDCGSAVPEFPIEVYTGLCDLLRWEYKDEIFAGTGGGCYKVFRKWQLVNSCQLVNGQEAFPLPRDIQADGHVNYLGDRTFSARDIVDGQLLGNYGHFIYTQIIKVQDTEAPTIAISLDGGECLNNGTNCRSVKTFVLTGEDCTFNKDINFKYELYEGNTLVKQGEGPNIEYEVSSFESYTVKAEAFDNCGNSSSTEQLFGFKDCSIPVALCNGNNINIEITADRQSIVPALWLNGNSADNCDTELDYRIWHSTVSEVAPSTVENALLLPNQIILACNDIEQTTAILYVIDDSNNFSSCSTKITIQNSKGYCPPRSGRQSKVSGTVATVEGQKIQDVEMRFATYSAPTLSEMTDQEGYFDFEIEEGNTYTLSPRKNENLLNGVSTFDLVLIQRHILGVDLLDSPYKYIAADVNRSGTITAYDMVQLRQVILNIQTEFTNNWSWRFVSAAYPMDTKNPLEAYEEEHQLVNASDGMQVDFIGVKIGDVSGDAVTNELMTTEPRSQNGALKINVLNQDIKKGERYLVEFNLDQATIEGYQFTLQYEHLSLIQWLSGQVTPNYLGMIKNKENHLTVSWNKPPNSIELAKQIFTLEFEAQKDGQLKDFLSLSDQPTRIEAYTDTEEIIDITLDFKELENNQPFEVFQNKPNPFSDQTSIGFYLPNSSYVAFTLMDVTGTVIHQSSTTYEKGKHELLIDRQLLPMNGVFYYHIETALGRVTKSMLVVN